MIYKSSSIQEVIARVIRNTRVQDSSYLVDMVEWIPEAMGYMRTKQEMKYDYKDVEISFHKGKMPCGLNILQAVEYEGKRLNYRNSVKHYATGSSTPTESNAIPLFVSEVTVQNQEEFTGKENHIWKSDLKSINECSLHEKHYYQTELDYINTSFADGTVRLHFLGLPVASDGFPLIPDNENYKEALYYYVRAKMIGCGYVDSVFKEQELLQRFEAYAARAMGQIKYPSVDVMESRINTHVRFIPPANYWESFFKTDSPEPMY